MTLCVLPNLGPARCATNLLLCAYRVRVLRLGWCDGQTIPIDNLVGQPGQ